MGKRGRSHKKEDTNSKRRNHDEDIASEDMDDEIDAFHKQRYVIPIDINGGAMESDDDDDNEHPVFDLEGVDDDDDDADEDDDDDIHESGLAAKIARQQKFLRDKFGGVEDEMNEGEDEEEEEKKAIWGGRKSRYYDADNRDYELQSSDDESPAEEEEEVLRLQREKAKALSLEDFGLEDISQDESDRELTLEEMSVKEKSKGSMVRKETIDDMHATYEEVKKDLNALTKEEQMDVLYSSAPELVGLLSELNDALDQLESRVNPLISKVKNSEVKMEGGLRYLEMKQLILLSYCQAITFYLILKSEGQPVRDHPVIARLVEIKSLLDKTKHLEGNLPSEIEEILNRNKGEEMLVNLIEENAPEYLTGDIELSSIYQKEAELPRDSTQLENVDNLKDRRKTARKQKQQDDQVGVQSLEMLKVRAALEEKLKQKGILGSSAPKHDKTKKYLQPVNGQLETYHDFDDDTLVEKATNLRNGLAYKASSDKLSHLVTAKLNKPKVVSGDDDLPKRDDVGERRRKHELQVLASAGIKSEEVVGFDNGNLGEDADRAMEEDSETGESEDEFYKQVKQQRAAKLAAKAELYSRTPAAPSLPEIVDGKRHITYQMEKNRGLTRARKKLTKNPRKKYKLKYKDAANRRKGQVREIKKPTHLYGGEASGINAGISRSIRFKN